MLIGGGGGDGGSDGAGVAVREVVGHICGSVLVSVSVYGCCTLTTSSCAHLPKLVY